MISLNKRLSLSKVPSSEVEEAVLQNLKQALSLNRRTQDRLKGNDHMIVRGKECNKPKSEGS